MQAKLINGGAERTFALILETGDEVVSSLERFAAAEHLAGSRFTAIGAFMGVTLGYFDWETKTYESIPIDEQVEVLSLLGDIVLQGREPKLHAHAVLGKRDGSAWGGHLLEARVRPTLEVLITDAPGHLQRVFDPVTGLALIRADK